jgi:predicted nicotinamide N-methyase
VEEHAAAPIDPKTTVIAKPRSRCVRMIEPPPPSPMLARSGDPAALRAFIAESTRVGAPPLLPEIALHLVSDVTALWQVTERELAAAGLDLPFWAFAWAGGQALARHLLDAPERVRGRRVVDIASGSGLVAIAAALSGAASVVAVDCDPVAAEAIALNAARNGVHVPVLCADLQGEVDPAWATGAEVVLAGDVCYDRAMAPGVMAWLRRRREAGSEVLLGDPGRAYLPAEGLAEVARYTVPTPDGVEAREEMVGVVYRLA